ncbi:GDSL-type esterase/lipase family protein [Bifidobacterium callitrichidarum]|nr:GDSL-type esterase/lipase family protein [Bifidobacterium callitrichidarum]
MKKNRLSVWIGICLAVALFMQTMPAGAVEVNPYQPEDSTSQAHSSERNGVSDSEDSARSPQSSQSQSEPLSQGNPQDAQDNQSVRSKSPISNGWIRRNGQSYWYDNGVMARSKEVYDPASDAWYWFDADGVMAHDKDVYLSSSRKWVRYDSSGHMIKGEDHRYGGWYYFDPITGAMQYGFVYLPSRKWVYYNTTTGRMQYGEQHINGGWYYLDPVTGAVHYGWQYLQHGKKWVVYDWPTGRMLYGNQIVTGQFYYFDPVTGAFDSSRSANPRPSSVVPSSAAEFGQHLRARSYRSVRVLGDSLAAGMGAQADYWTTTTPLFSYEGVQYYEPAHDIDSAFNQLRAELSKNGATMFNASVPRKGSMKAYLSLGQETLGNEDAAIVMLGTNDRLVSTLSEFQTNAEAYLQSVADRYHGNMVVVAGPPVVDEHEAFSMSDVNAVLRDICTRHGWQFASMYEAFNQMSVAYGVPIEGLMQDGVHPNHLGQEAMWDALRQLLGL